MDVIEPLAHPASLPELVSAWGARYHYLYKLIRVLRLSPSRGDKNALMLSLPQQQQLADVLNARTPRPRDIEQLHAEDLHAELDRLTKSFDRLSAAYEVTAALAHTYKEHLDQRDTQQEDWRSVAQALGAQLDRIEAVLALSDSPDFATSLKAVKTLNHPAETPLADVAEAGLLCAAVAGILARRHEADEEAYTRLVQACAQQPLGMLRGELIGALFTLGAVLEAALTVHRDRHADASAEVLNLEDVLTTVLGQLKIWGNDALPWLGARVRPLAPEPPVAADPTPARA